MKNNIFIENKPVKDKKPSLDIIQNDELYNQYQELINNKLNLIRVNNNLDRTNVCPPKLVTDIELNNKKMAGANKSLACANTQASSLTALIALKDQEIKELNKSLTELNARSVALVAKRELQVERIKELNRELQYEVENRQKTEESLKKSNEAKDRFFSMIAHDLRTPFISIVGLATVLNEHAESFTKEEIIELIEDLHSNAQNTQNLLENLLEWSKTQTNRIRVEPGLFSLHSIIDETLPVCSHSAAMKNITIETEVCRAINIWADKNMISTVIRNLLSNAIKFSNKNSKIIISAVRINNKTKISITDFGIGINQENIERLFRLDYKVSSKGTANEKGSGLGLILCKEFVEKNGGEISIESKVGKGSIFSFTIPSEP